MTKDFNHAPGFIQPAYFVTDPPRVFIKNLYPRTFHYRTSATHLKRSLYAPRPFSLLHNKLQLA